MAKTPILISMVFYFFILCISQCRDCTVTENVTLTDCVLHCWNKYQGKRDFYEFNSGICQERITCGPGYYNDYVNNICIDEFGGYVLKEIGWIITVKENHVRFAQIQVLKGYFVSHKLICDDGWKSSMRTQKRNQMTLIIYLCDQKLKDGEIYPKTHGQYFFQQLSQQQKVTALNNVFGHDSLSSILTIRMGLFLALTSLYLILNCFACLKSFGNKKNLNSSEKKQTNKKQQKLTQSQNKEIQDYLEKRKQLNIKQFGQMKQFSFQAEIKGQLELMEKIKQQSQQIMKKKWKKRLKKKEEEKRRQEEKQEYKKQVRQNKPEQFFRFWKSKKKEEKENLPVEQK